MSDLPLILKNESQLNSEDIETLFDIFQNDFITNITVLKINNTDYTITAKPHNQCDCPFVGENKPERFWHIITKKEFDTKKRNNPCPDDKEKNRIYCSSRAKRIHWIKQTIDNSSDEHIKYFFENNSEPTHFLWDTKRFYIVIIKHLGNSENLLVTAYPVHKNKYRDYKNRLNRYEKNQHE
jgi:hypothetical protein